MRTMQYIYATGRVLVACLAGLLVAGCGGGGDAEATVAQEATALRAPQAPQAARIPDATALMDWAEGQYPQFFPGHSANINSAPFVYRAYANGNYLGLDGVDIYILGPSLSGGVLQRVGTTTDFACNVYPASCVVVPAGPSSLRGSILWTTSLGSQGYGCVDCHFNPRQNFSNIWNASGTPSDNGNPLAISQAIAANQGGVMFQFDVVSAADLADIAAYINASRYGKTLQ